MIVELHLCERAKCHDTVIGGCQVCSKDKF